MNYWDWQCYSFGIPTREPANGIPLGTNAASSTSSPNTKLTAFTVSAKTPDFIPSLNYSFPSKSASKSMAIFDTVNEKDYKYAEMYIDMVKNAFNMGFIATADKIYTLICLMKPGIISRTSKQNINLLRFLTELDIWKITKSKKEDTLSDIEKILKTAQDEYYRSSREEFDRNVLRAERMRLIETAKELLELIEDENVKEKQFDNIGKIELDPTNFMQQVFDSYDDDLDTIEAILKKSKCLFTDEELEPFQEKLSEKQAEKRKKSTYNFKSICLNISNVEDANILIEAARKSIRAGNDSKARRLLDKAERMDPMRSAKHLFDQLIIEKVESDTRQPQIIRQCDNTRRQFSDKRQLGDDLQKREQECKQIQKEQIEAIRRVKASRNDYEILGLPNDATTAQIKRAFRKLSLVLHPDQNKNVGADDAFMIVTEAMNRAQRRDKDLKARKAK